MGYRKDLSKNRLPNGVGNTQNRLKSAFSYEETESEYGQEKVGKSPTQWASLLVRLFFVLLMLLLIAFGAFGQNRKVDNEDFELLVEELFQMQDIEVDYSDLYESLFQYYSTPINLNQTTPEELRGIYLLSENQIQDFFNHIGKYGKLLSIYELQAIPSFDIPTIRRLLPFVTVREAGNAQDNRSVFERILKEKNNFLIFRYDRTLQQKQGFRISPTDTTSSGDPRSRYLGSPDKLYLRYRIAHTNDFSLGFVAEKDQGEQLVWDPETKRYGPDFFTAHFMLENQGIFKNITVGDYMIQVGQGLILSAGFGVGKGSESIATLRRSTIGIRPYNSVLESGFFRGAATEVELSKRLSVIAFASRTRQDANVSYLAGDTLSAEEAFISSIQETGFHRTAREIASKNQITELAAGTHLRYKSQALNMGLTAVNFNLSTPILRNDSKYNQFEFNGRNNFLVGADYDFTWRNFTFFGEGARSQSGGLGYTGGVIMGLARQLDLAIHVRHYDKDFHSFRSAAFSEGSRNINETGIYWGIKIKPNRRWLLTAYYDRFRFPWLRFQVDAPSSGHEYLARLTHKPSRKITMYAHFRQEVREKNWQTDGLTLNAVRPYRRRNYQFNVNFRAEEYLSLRSRVQFSTYEHNEEFSDGYAIIQDVNFDLGKVRLSTRFALFQTDDYENRQYAYEKDVLYVFYIPAYFGQGFRNMYLLQLRPTKKLDIWVKYAFTKYRNQETISSGLEQIEGDLKTDVRVQLRYKFR